MEYLHLVAHNLAYYLQGLDYGKDHPFPPPLTDYGQELLGLITPTQHIDTAKVWSVVFNAALGALWLMLVAVLLVAIFVNVGYRGPRVTVTGRDTPRRILEIPVGMRALMMTYYYYLMLSSWLCCL